MNAPRIAFRAEASAAIGGGHIMRCLTLAQALTARGAEIAFWVNAEAISAVPALAKSGFALHQGELDPKTAPPPDALILDLFGAQIEAQSALRRQIAGPLIVLDDLADRAHDCDLLINPNFGVAPTAYDALLPANVPRLIGPQYAPLRPAFAAARPQALAQRAARPSVQRVMVSMGLTDLGGITARIAATLLDACDAQLDIVIGPSALSHAALAAMPKQRLHLHGGLDGEAMAALMSGADLAIGAGGSTSWERCCLGLPTIILVLADNQAPTAQALAAAGAAIHSTETEWPRHLAELATDPARRAAMSARAAAICDGEGAARTAQAILETLQP